ncbi:MAG: hypothetical protein M1826_004487 [Phylliscum demangeonii]|nr:MAG: hypothetical protein M1826_004487 [Phylliscum demangeonii]
MVFQLTTCECLMTRAHPQSFVTANYVKDRLDPGPMETARNRDEICFAFVNRKSDIDRRPPPPDGWWR